MKIAAALSDMLPRRAFAGAFAVAAIFSFALAAREAQAELIAPGAVSAPLVITPHPVGGPPGSALRPEPPAGAAAPSAPAPASEPSPSTAPASPSATPTQPAGRNPVDSDRPDVNNSLYPGTLPLPENPGCDGGCVDAWWRYANAESQSFVDEIMKNGGRPTPADQARLDELNELLIVIIQIKFPPAKPKSPEPPPAPDPLETADGPLSNPSDGSDTPAGDTDASGSDDSGGSNGGPAPGPDSSSTAGPSDPAGGASGGGGWRDEDDPFLLID